MLRHAGIASSLVLALVGSLVWATASTAQDKQEREAQEAQKAQEERGSREFHSFPLEWAAGSGSYLGVFLEEVTPDRVRELGLSNERGALIMKVREGSPAEKAGLRENDVVVGFSGRRVDSVRELQRLLNETPPERTVSLDFIRGGNQMAVTVTLGKRQPAASLFGGYSVDQDQMRKQHEEAQKRIEELMKRHSAEQQKFSYGKSLPELGAFWSTIPGEFLFRGARLGITVETLTEQLAEFFGSPDKNALLVTEVREDSAAAKAGLRAGDVIIGIDDKRFDSPRAIFTELMRRPEGPVTLTIVRERRQEPITLNLEKPVGRFQFRDRFQVRPPRIYNSI